MPVMPSPPIQLVCFDLGGVLVRLSNGWIDACTRAGVKVGADDAKTWEAHQSLLHQLERGDFDEAAYERQLPTCLPNVPVKNILAAFDAWLCGIYPGAAELIADLKSRGVRTAILSNTNPRHWRTILKGDPQYAGIDRVDHAFASCELRLAKPDLRIYRAVEQGTGVRPNAILFFDDNEKNVEAARAAGWHAEQITAPDAVAQQREFLHRYGIL
jgi:HAD superfamily hydrolase (TIGR01509 family)